MKILGFFFALYYFFPFLWCVQKKKKKEKKKEKKKGKKIVPRWSFTTVLIVVFVWVSAYFLGLKVRCSELVQRKKMKVYFVLYKCWDFFFLLYFFPPFKSHWSFNKFLLKCLGRTVKCLHPNLPESACEAGGGAARSVSPRLPGSSTPSPPQYSAFFSGKELVGTSRLGLGCFGLRLGSAGFKQAV